MAEVVAASDAEKLSIANHLLMSSPPGQFNDVLEDVRKLVPASTLTPESLQAIARAYNVAVARVVTSTDGAHSFVLAKEGEVDGTHYVDAVAQKVVEVDHMTGQVLSTSDDPPPETPLQDLPLQTQEALDAYRVAQFTAPTMASCAFATPDSKLVLYVSGQKLNLRNWWSGSWVGRYEVTGLEGGGPVKISGHVDVCGHYFESGNMQLRSHRDLAADTLGAADAASIVAWVKEKEGDVFDALEEMYAGMSDSLKGMRRAVTVTSDKFSWNVAQIRMRNTLLAAKK